MSLLCTFKSLLILRNESLVMKFENVIVDYIVTVFSFYQIHPIYKTVHTTHVNT